MWSRVSSKPTARLFCGYGRSSQLLASHLRYTSFATRHSSSCVRQSRLQSGRISTRTPIAATTQWPSHILPQRSTLTVPRHSPRQSQVRHYAIVIEAPLSAEEHVKRGQADEKDEDNESALNHYTKAIALYGSTNASGLSLRANLLFMLRRFEESLADYIEVVRMAPQHIPSQTRIADCHAHLKQYSDAITHYERAIFMDTKYLPAYSGRGDVHLQLGSLDRALVDFQRVLETDPQHLDAWIGVGDICAQRGEVVRAAKSFHRATTIDPTFWRGFSSLGMIQYVQQDTEKAVQSFSSAIDLNPPADVLPELLHRRASTSLLLGNVENALADCESCLDLGKDSPLVYLTRAQCLAQMGRYLAATEDYTTFIERSGPIDTSDVDVDVDVPTKEKAAMDQQIAQVLELRSQCYLELFQNQVAAAAAEGVASASAKAKEEKKERHAKKRGGGKGKRNRDTRHEESETIAKEWDDEADTMEGEDVPVTYTFSVHVSAFEKMGRMSKTEVIEFAEEMEGVLAYLEEEEAAGRMERSDNRESDPTEGDASNGSIVPETWVDCPFPSTLDSELVLKLLRKAVHDSLMSLHCSPDEKARAGKLREVCSIVQSYMSDWYEVEEDEEGGESAEA
eukprot:TRINITY_DN4470_c0_g1_i2.p1 TRINITY_DN4470_c0_g1~~TRINITY_DN4470_c0_g1_i2.p1  ORF type:complete len:623 (+),score=102.28 TRINITY_DN4470_c0_g1_i2:162-2030(+)